jgi:uncharacterized protein YuzE
MRFRFDEQADALYIWLDEAKIVESEEIGPGVVLDFNAQNEVVGVEILDVKKRLPAADLKHMLVEIS